MTTSAEKIRRVHTKGDAQLGQSPQRYSVVPRFHLRPVTDVHGRLVSSSFTRQTEPLPMAEHVAGEPAAKSPLLLRPRRHERRVVDWRRKDHAKFGMVLPDARAPTGCRVQRRNGLNICGIREVRQNCLPPHDDGASIEYVKLHAELESLAREVRRRAHIAPDDYVRATDVAVALVGDNGVVLDDKLAGSAYLLDLGERFQIVFRLDAPDARFRLLHECSHVAIRTLTNLRLSPDEEERAANFVAAAIIAPPALVRRAHRAFGESFDRIAEAFGLSRTATVLRLAEVLADERGVVTAGRTSGRRHVLVRNASAVDWSDPEIIKEADRKHRRFPGLAKTRFVGGLDDGRVAFRVK